MIISKLEQCEKDYSDPRLVINDLYPSAKYHFFKAGITNSNLLSDGEELDNRINPCQIHRIKNILLLIAFSFVIGECLKHLMTCI